MKKFKQNIIVCSIVAALGMGYTPKTEALIPTTDIANLAEGIAGNIQDMYNWAEEKTMMMMDMDLSSMMEELSINNENNAIANMIVRNGAAKQEIQNLEIAEQSTPDMDAPDTATIQVLEESATCSSTVNSKKTSEESLEDHCQFETPEKDQIKENREIVKGFIEDCENLKRDSDSGSSLGMNGTMCTQASILVGAGTLDTLDENQSKAVKNYIKLISGVNPDIKKSYKYKADSVAKRESLIREMRKEAFRNLAVTSLNEIAYMRISEEGRLAPLHLLSEFDSNRYKSLDWSTKVSNTSISAKNSVYPSQILRKMAVMDSFLVHMSVLQYKQSLRQEAIDAASLAIQVEPLK